MSVDVVCGKCGSKITSMKTLKPIKELMNPHKGKCPSCGHAVSTSEFTLDVQDR